MISFEVPEDLATEAEELGLDVVEACRKGLWLIMRKERQEREWKEEHRDAIRAYSRWIEEHGLPLDRYRLL